MRTFISLPAGFAEMPPLRFGIYTTIGCIPWTAGLAWAGYAVGANWQQIVNDFHGVTYVIAAVVVLAVLIALWVFFRRRRAEIRSGGRHGNGHGHGARHARPQADRTR